MNLSGLMITRSTDLNITQAEISARTSDEKCAALGGTVISRQRVHQLWHNKPEIKVLQPRPTVVALAYALECTELEVYVANLHTIGVLQADGPQGTRFIAVAVNGFTEDEMQRIVHAGQAAMDQEKVRITRMEQRKRG